MATEGMTFNTGEVQASKPAAAPAVKTPSPKSDNDVAPDVSRPDNAEKKLSEEFVEKVTRELNDEFRIFNTALSFSVDDSTGSTVIKILDRNTDKVVREIPPNQMLQIAAKLTEVIGRIVDETA